jgi:CubicO group peptidase (beta-lactamase class C family)
MNVFQEIEAHILPSTRIAQYGAPSASVAILENDDVQTHVFTKNDEDSQTMYLADSNTKPITALGIARLVDQGLLNFTDKITDFMEPSSFLHHPESGEMIKHVTIQMLLTHTSGLVKKSACDHSDHPEFSRNACLQFNHFHGSKWHYENDAFALVQLAMEKVSGTPFPKLMHQLVTRPLGMTRTSWGQLPKDETDFAKPHAGSVQMKPRPACHEAELSTMGMWSTPSDMVKAISAVQKSLQASTSFLSQDTAKFMLITGAKPTRSIGESPEKLALGWFATSTTFGHRGCRPGNGYHCYFFGFHGLEMGGLQSTSCAVMTNSHDGLEAIRALINAVMYVKQWPRQEIMPSNLGIDASTPCAAPKSIMIDPQWEKWIGDWSRDSQRGCELRRNPTSDRLF